MHFIIFSCVVLRAVLARPDGEPWPDACETMSPGNGVPPQTGPMPYSLLIDSEDTAADGCIYFTIKGGDTDETMFAGFMVQTRDKTGKPIGTFKEADDVRLLECFGSPDNTAFTINYLPKEEVNMRWFPDRNFTGIVHIYASIAQDYMEQIYWIKQKTKPIKVTPPKDIF